MQCSEHWLTSRMRLWFLCLVFLLGFSTWTGAASAAAGSVSILCYHDVGQPLQKGELNRWTVTEGALEGHFQYLKDNGYTVISINDYIAYAKGERPAPEKAVLLTFDDGYVSFYTKVYPLLKKYNYSAVVSVVGTWMDGNPAPDDIGKVVSWNQLREMEQSGLVEVASHSYNMHRRGIATPQGDGGVPAENRFFDGRRYESEQDHRTRLAYDFARGQEQFVRELGHPARVIVWPYGGYTAEALELAQQAGFTVSLGLGGGLNKMGDKALMQAKRGIIFNNPNNREFAQFLKTRMEDWRARPIRMAQVDIDALYDKDPQQMAANIRQLLTRLDASKVTAVALQAFADPKGDGNMEKVYFATNQAPVAVDVFGHISRILSDEGYPVFAWFPSLAGQWLLTGHPEDAVVASEADKAGWYRRASPFSQRVRQQMNALAEDLAAYSWVDGILLQDDLYLNDYEDFSPAAKAAYLRDFGRPLTPDIRKDPARMDEWTEWKTKTLETVGAELVAAVRKHRPDAVVLRNIYAEAVLSPETEECYAQNYEHYLQLYDYTVIMAYPYMEKHGDDPAGWLKDLTAVALEQSAAKQKVIFKLQTYDWDEMRWLSARDLKRQVAALKTGGALHLGYYPEVMFDPTAALGSKGGREVYDQP